MSYNLTISITDIETENPEQLEILCEMMAELCEAVCRKCDYDTVKRFGLANYELEEEKK